MANPFRAFFCWVLVQFGVLYHLQRGKHSCLKVRVTTFNMDSKIIISNDVAKSKLQLTYISLY